MDITLNGSDDFGFDPAKFSEETHNYLKQHMFMYQNLIPGESDEIFIPPATTAKQHSGPRALHVDMQVSETDSTQSTSETGKTPTISSYMKELKEDRNGKRLNYSRAVQCVSLPTAYKNRKDLEVSDVIPTRDTKHVLVILASSSADRNSVLLLYPLGFEGKMVRLGEEPLMVRELCSFERPVEASLLVQLERAGTTEGTVRKGPDGTVIMVCVDGVVRMIQLATLRTASVARLEDEKFVSAAYCNSKCFVFFWLVLWAQVTQKPRLQNSMI